MKQKKKHIQIGLCLIGLGLLSACGPSKGPLDAISELKIAAQKDANQPSLGLESSGKIAFTLGVSNYTGNKGVVVEQATSVSLSEGVFNLNVDGLSASRINDVRLSSYLGGNFSFSYGNVADLVYKSQSMAFYMNQGSIYENLTGSIQMLSMANLALKEMKIITADIPAKGFVALSDEEKTMLDSFCPLNSYYSSKIETIFDGFSSKVKEDPSGFAIGSENGFSYLDITLTKEEVLSSIKEVAVELYDAASLDKGNVRIHYSNNGIEKFTFDVAISQDHSAVSSYVKKKSASSTFSLSSFEGNFTGSFKVNKGDDVFVNIPTDLNEYREIDPSSVNISIFE